MEENYYLASETVLTRYSKDEKYYPLFVLALYGLFSKYPNYKKYIIQIFCSTTICVEDNPISDILKRFRPSLYESYQEDENNPDGYDTYGISFPDYSLYINDDNKVVIEKDRSLIICNSKLDNTSLLNVFIHEMSHLLKSHVHCYGMEYKEDMVGYWIRSGISYYEMQYVISEDITYEINCFDMMEEVINTIQTAEAMREIKTLDGILPKNEDTFFQTLNKEEMDNTFGYDSIIKYILPLWKNPDFKEVVEKHIVEGDIQDVVQYFDEHCYLGSFEELGDLIDYFYSSKSSKASKRKVEKEIFSIISKYQRAKKKTLTL